MANLTISVGDRLGIVGVGAPTKWGTLVYGTNRWGTDDNLGWHLQKGFSDSISLGDSLTKLLEINIAISFSLTMTDDTEDSTLGDGSGYNYVFPDNQTDYDQRIPQTSWTDADGNPATWTPVTPNSTTWS